VLRWIYHNAGVSWPNNQVARLRLPHALKFFVTRIEIRGWLISVREACFFVNRVDQMRAIGTMFRLMAGLKRGAEYGEAVAGIQKFRPAR